jgi:hypothetical protein
MVRALLECPTVLGTTNDCRGKQYKYEGQGESDTYKEWVKQFDDWDTGITP